MIGQRCVQKLGAISVSHEFTIPGSKGERNAEVFRSETAPPKSNQPKWAPTWTFEGVPNGWELGCH